MQSIFRIAQCLYWLANTSWEPSSWGGMQTMVNHLEMMIRNQTKSRNWFTYKAGQITAYRFRQVLTQINLAYCCWAYVTPKPTNLAQKLGFWVRERCSSSLWHTIMACHSSLYFVAFLSVWSTLFFTRGIDWVQLLWLGSCGGEVSVWLMCITLSVTNSLIHDFSFFFPLEVVHLYILCSAIYLFRLGEKDN